MRSIFLVFVFVLLSGCASVGVRQEDLDAWVAEPVASLELHPFFVTLPVIKTMASDGTEIWNFVNGRNIGGCSGGGTVFAGNVNYATYSQFMGCMQSYAACNNIFYIKDGVVLRYVPTGTGGLRCMTDERLQPGYTGSGNFR
jgi:hypothetical protein